MLDQLLAGNLSGIPIPSITSLDPVVLKIIIIGASIFLFLLLFAFTRHHIIAHSIKGLWAGLVLGISVVLGLEAGAYYLYTNYIVGGKGAQLPENFQAVLRDGTQSLEPVLGKAIERETPTAREVLKDYNSLSKEDAADVREAVCKKR